MGPAKLMEVSPEGDFKDSITRKRWLGRQRKYCYEQNSDFETGTRERQTKRKKAVFRLVSSARQIFAAKMLVQ